ncbi:MAG: S8 family serine peptidase [Rubrivivax sp.]
MQRLLGLLTSLALAFAVTACGGGGGGGGQTPQTPGLLAGEASAAALPALPAVEPSPAEAADIDGGVLLTRLSVTLRADATIGQVNAAAQRVGALSFTFAQPGGTAITLAVPRQANAAALDALAAQLEGQPGILFASAGRQVAPLELPASGGSTANSGDFEHLLATRFPAAWNVRRAAEAGCSGRKVTVIVPDLYFGTPSDFSSQLEASFSFDRTLAEPTSNQSADSHGFRVVGTLAAKFDSLPSTGANPAPACLTLRLVNVHGLTGWELVAATIAAVRRDSGPVIVSSSVGYSVAVCGPNGTDTCTEADVAAVAGGLRRNVRNHFDQGIDWAAFAMQPDIVERMVVVQAAGNDANKLLGRVYAGLRSGPLGSPFAIAGTLGDLDRFATDPALWAPAALPGTPIAPAPESLALDAATISALKLLRDRKVSGPITDRNLLLVGAATNQPRLADLQPAPFSNDGASVFAVGQNVTAIDLTAVDGTSFAAPQVAGLASYLWLLEPALAAQPAATTAELLRSSAQNNVFFTRAVDAWRAVLALDAGAAPTPATARMRLAALDVEPAGNPDGDFDLADLQAFRNAYLDSAGAPREPATPDYSRFDLNGDGFTGGRKTTPMDVDPTGSTRFGAPVLTRLQLPLGNATLSIDETAVTDAQALCFYAKSALYSGTDLAARDALLAQLCPVAGTVSISLFQPTDPILLPLCGGIMLQVSVGGASDPSVTVSVTGPAVTAVSVEPEEGDTIIRLDIPQTALSGVFRVTAASNADPSVSVSTTYEIDTGIVPWGNVRAGRVDVDRSRTSSGYRFSVIGFGSDKDGGYTGASPLVGTRLDGATVTISTSDGLRGTAVFTSSTGVQSTPVSVTNDNCIVL